MADTRIRFDIKDRREWDRVRKKLRDMADRAKDVSPAWHALLTWFGEQNLEQFLNRGARYHTAWPPLAVSTREGKLRQNHPLDPLIRTGDLAQSLTSRPLSVEHVTPHEMAGGTDIRYAGFHQRGTDRMPQRKLFDPAQIRRERAATTACANWILKGQARVGGRAVLRGGR